MLNKSKKAKKKSKTISVKSSKPKKKLAKKVLKPGSKDGRPTKWDDKYKISLQRLYAAGYTDKEVCEVIHITRQSLDNWKKKYPDFFASLKDWKIDADRKVERSLFERATGYSHRETKFAIHEGVFTDQKETIKHYPPDPTSGIFWLKNRQPDKYRDRPNEESDKVVEIKLSYDPKKLKKI